MQTLSLFDLMALLLTLSALFAWLNHKFLALPQAVGLLVMSVAASLVLVAIDVAVPGQHLFEPLTAALLQIDFTNIVMNGMLAFLLFAGALHIDVGRLRSRALPIVVLATFGTIASTLIVGVSFWAIAKLFDQPLSLAWALVFGALISPTDPVAVMSTLKSAGVPPNLEIEMQGESLFNDGIGIVLFTVLLRFAVSGGGEETSPAAVAELLVREAGGGLLLGLITGYIAYRGMRLIDDYPVEVLMSLALVTGTYALAQALHMSGPLAVVAAGLLIGEQGPRYAMSQRTQNYVFALWTLIDEILNALLFLLIGLEVLVLRYQPLALGLAAFAIPVVLLARATAVAIPPIALAWLGTMSIRHVPFLTWAGVRGGISIALALSIPTSEARPAILAATYAVVLFSVIVQGSTLGVVARMVVPPSKDDAPG
jgi:CPA1 family monovalent cation:H+ antiporter